MMNGRKAATLEKINRAAQNLLFLYGIKGWSMDEFAKEAGLTKRTLYKYVDSKEELVERVLLGFIQNTQADLIGQLRIAPDFLSGMETILDLYPGMIMKLNSRVIQDIFKQYPAIEAHLIEQQKNLTKDIRAYLDRWQNKGSVKRDVDHDTVIEIMQSLILYYAKSSPDHFGEKLRESFKIVIYGIIPEGVR